MKFEITGHKQLWKGFFSMVEVKLRHQLYKGGYSPTIRRELLERGDAVGVLLHDPKTDHVLLIEQFRVGAAVREPKDAWMIEIVAGIVETGETWQDVARRESIEEADCSVDLLEHIIDFYPSAGGCSERIRLYYAPVDLSAVTTGIRGLDHEHEDIRTLIVPRTQAMQWLAEGRIQASTAIIALQWLTLKQAPKD